MTQFMLDKYHVVMKKAESQVFAIGFSPKSYIRFLTVNTCRVFMEYLIVFANK